MWHVALVIGLVNAAGAFPADPQVVLFGMTVDEVENALAGCGACGTWSRAAGDHYGVNYIRADCLGGVQRWCVEFGTRFDPVKQRVEEYTFWYTPFEERPEWLPQALYDLLDKR